jgi:L-cysteate sulfo-lyase
VPIDWVVHGTGSAGTQAGLLAGLHAIHSQTKVLGVSVRQKQPDQVEVVHRLAEATAARLGATVPRAAVHVDDRWVGGGYGVPTDSMIDAVRTLAIVEGILLDPVYTGKGFAGLLGAVAEGRFASTERVVFLHTGGSAGLFGYRNAFTRP